MDYLYLQIPVYRGVDRALTGTDAGIPSYYHGNDGFGEAPDPDVPDLSVVQSEHAVIALIRLVNQHPGIQFTTVTVALRRVTFLFCSLGV